MLGDRLSAARRSYAVGLHRADRIGFERGSAGQPPEHAYRRPDYEQSYMQGWRRGANWNIGRLRGKAKTAAIFAYTSVVYGSALKNLAQM